MSTSIIKPISTTADLGGFWEILAGSEGYYPNAKDGRLKWFKKLSKEVLTYYGVFREGNMVGGMAIADFEVNVRMAMVKLSSVGMVHTDILHKKEKVCKDMMEYFIGMNREKGVNLLTLTPFRPEFYRQMGFGYGSCLYQYRIPPLSFPDSGSKDGLHYLGAERKQDYLDCVARISRKTHGMIRPFRLVTGPFGDGCRVLAYERNGEMKGVLAYSFPRDREMTIEEMHYGDTETLHAFCSFLHSQSDNFDRILFQTPDAHFYYLLRDPTNGTGPVECCTSAIHNMFRVIHVPGIFAELRDVSFNDQNTVIEVAMRDTLYPQNAGSTVVEFRNGHPIVHSNYTGTIDARLALDVSDFSSLLMGSIGVRALHRLGLSKIQSEREVDLLDRVFSYGQMPLSEGGL